MHCEVGFHQLLQYLSGNIMINSMDYSKIGCDVVLTSLDLIKEDIIGGLSIGLSHNVRNVPKSVCPNLVS